MSDHTFLLPFLSEVVFKKAAREEQDGQNDDKQESGPKQASDTS